MKLATLKGWSASGINVLSAKEMKTIIGGTEDKKKVVTCSCPRGNQTFSVDTCPTYGANYCADNYTCHDESASSFVSCA